MSKEVELRLHGALVRRGASASAAQRARGRVMTDVGSARTGWRAPPATVGLGLRVWGNLGFRHSLASGAGM